MTGMPFSLLRLGYPENGEEYFEIDYPNSTYASGVLDLPLHKHHEPTFFEDDDFFDQNYKNRQDEFELLMKNYTFVLHYTGRRWYGESQVCHNRLVHNYRNS